MNSPHLYALCDTVEKIFCRPFLPFGMLVTVGVTFDLLDDASTCAKEGGGGEEREWIALEE